MSYICVYDEMVMLNMIGTASVLDVFYVRTHNITTKRIHSSRVECECDSMEVVIVC